MIIFKSIMHPAEQLHVLDRRFATFTEVYDMIKLQLKLGLTPLAIDMKMLRYFIPKAAEEGSA